MSKKNKLSEFAIDKALRDAGILETSDKEEIKRQLNKRRSGGITESDIIAVARRLKTETDDTIDRTEAEAAKRALLDELDHQ